MPSHNTAAKSSPRAPSLPKALAERAQAQHAAKLARLRERARDAIARIRERQVDVAANMVDIGLALAELKGDGMAEALGRASFAEVCALDLRMSPTTARTLIDIATRVPREVVTRLGADRARAVLELVDATPDNDTPETLLRAKLTLPSGRTLDVAAASTRELRDAAKELRQARARTASKRTRGFTTTPDEKKSFAVLARHVKDVGADPAEPSLVRFRGDVTWAQTFLAPKTNPP